MDIIGYTYQADNYCPACILEYMEEGTLIPGGIMAMDTEDALDALAFAAGIDRHHERAYDSGDFPKVIFSWQTEDDETCAMCGGVL